jgi:hypothetical protein
LSLKESQTTKIAKKQERASRWDDFIASKKEGGFLSEQEKIQVK